MAIPGELLIGGHRFKVDLVWQKQDWGRVTLNDPRLDS